MLPWLLERLCGEGANSNRQVVGIQWGGGGGALKSQVLASLYHETDNMFNESHESTIEVPLDALQSFSAVLIMTHAFQTQL